jgi:ankyrin repeat protein
MSPNLALFAAIRSADAAAVRQALASGADKNAKSNGTPAITLSVQSGKLNLVQLLAGAGADVNAPDAQGITPLAHARARGLDAIANSLIGSGAN